MSRRAPFKQADVTRALRGSVAAGHMPSAIRINSETGEIVVQFGNDNPASTNSFDQLMGGR